MKHGVLILAHQYPHHLIDLINLFDEDFFFFIHIDRRNNFTKSDFADLRKIPRVELLSSKLRVKWGGMNHLNAILLLAKASLTRGDLGYFHVISGQDYPIKSMSYIKELSESNPAGYLDYFEVLKSSWRTEWINRLSYFGFYEIFNSKTFLGNKLINGAIKLQRMIGFSRALPATKLYGGSGWWSLSRETLTYVIDYTTRNPSLLRRLRFTFCADEVYFQTVLMNSPWKEKIVNNNLRFIDWTERNGNFPANLDESDYESLKKSDKIFARKFEFPVSEKLKMRIDQDLFSKHL